MNHLSFVEVDGQVLLKKGNQLFDPELPDHLPSINEVIATNKGRALGDACQIFSNQAVTFIAELSSGLRKEMLAAADVVNALAHAGHAATIIEWIRAFPQDDQKDILAAPRAVFALTRNGQAQETCALIEAHPLDNQRDILAAPYAVWGFVRWGYSETGEKILTLIEDQPEANQAVILSATGTKDALDLGNWKLPQAIAQIVWGPGGQLTQHDF